MRGRGTQFVADARHVLDKILERAVRHVREIGFEIRSCPLDQSLLVKAQRRHFVLVEWRPADLLFLPDRLHRAPACAPRTERDGFCSARPLLIGQLGEVTRRLFELELALRDARCHVETPVARLRPEEARLRIPALQQQVEVGVATVLMRDEYGLMGAAVELAHERCCDLTHALARQLGSIRDRKCDGDMVCGVIRIAMPVVDAHDLNGIKRVLRWQVETVNELRALFLSVLLVRDEITRDHVAVGDLVADEDHSDEKSSWAFSRTTAIRFTSRASARPNACDAASESSTEYNA